MYLMQSVGTLYYTRHALAINRRPIILTETAAALKEGGGWLEVKNWSYARNIISVQVSATIVRTGVLVVVIGYLYNV